MSIGNTKTQGNKGNNYPYQLAALKLAGMSLMKNLEEVSMGDNSSGLLQTHIDNYFNTYPDKYLVSKVIVYDGTKWYAFLTVASNI